MRRGRVALTSTLSSSYPELLFYSMQFVVSVQQLASGQSFTLSHGRCGIL